MEDRIKTLEALSSLKVSTYVRKSVRYFVFSDDIHGNIKTTCTYPKAKLFAEGIALGKVLIGKALAK